MEEGRKCNNLVLGILRLCAAAVTLSRPKLTDGKIYPRPKVKCKIAGREIIGLADSGASLSVISENVYRKLWANWNFVKLPMPNHLRVTGITGHTVKFVDYVLMDIEMMGRTISRPMLVASGLEHTELVIGWDTMREEHMIVDGVENTVYFKDRVMKKEDSWHAAALCATRAEKIEPRTVAKLILEPRVAKGTLHEGTMGICYAAHGAPLVIWDSLTGVDENGRITMAVANFGEEPVNVKPDDCVGFMKNPEFDDTQIVEGHEEFVHSMFGEMGADCKEPEQGQIKKLNAVEEKEFLSKLNLKCPSEWKQKYLRLIMRYNDVFSKDKFDIGFTNIIEHKVNMKTEDPIYVKQFRVPYEHQGILNEYVDELLKKGAIQDSKSPYNSPVFCVPKKVAPGADPDEAPPLRCVLDFRAINRHAIPQKYSMKDVRECLDDIGRADAKLYSQLDLTSGFWQQSLAKESRPYTAFTVPGKLGAKFEWCVMPMGLQGSSSSFARLLNYVLRGVAGISSYIDDVLAFSDDHEGHLKVLEQVFSRFRKYGLKMNMSKSIFATTECQYLGFTLKQGEITTSKDKAAAIKNFPEPKSPRSVREYLGICNYFRGLIRNYHQKAEPLMKILNPGSGWKGGEMPEQARAAFMNLKEILSAEPVLTLPKKGRQYILYTDGALGDSANPGGMGAMLLQEDDQGQHHAIGFASRALKPNERNYSAYLLEQAAIVWSISYFEHYLAGNRFIVRSDNKPTVELGTVHKKTLSRLQELMLEYDFVLEHTEGKDNKAADALSRNACIMAIYAIDENEVSVEYAQRTCAEIGVLKNFLESGDLPEDEDMKKWIKRVSKTCHVSDDLVWHTEKRRGHREKQLLFVPKVMRRQLISEAHDRPEAGHGGVDRTAERVQMAFWWPNLRFDCQTYIQECITCQTARSSKPPPATLVPLPITTRVNERVHLDLFGDLRTSGEGNKFILVITDSFSKYTEIVAIPNKSAEQVAKAFFERWLIRFSAPECLVSDNGREFANKVVDEVLKLWGVESRKTTPWHPQTNSLAERYNQSIINYMKCMLTNDTTLEWEAWLPMLQLSYNAHIHRATRESPFYLIYGRDPRLPYTNFRKNRMYGESYAANQMKAQAEAWQRAVDNMKEAEEIRKMYYARKARDRTFHIGDRVLLHCPQPGRNQNRKFWKYWKLCRVMAKVGPVNLRLKTLKEEKGKKNEYLVHVDRCQHATQPQIEEFYDSIQSREEESDSEKKTQNRSETRSNSRQRKRRQQYLRQIEEAEDEGFQVEITRRRIVSETDHEDDHGQAESDHAEITTEQEKVTEESGEVENPENVDNDESADTTATTGVDVDDGVIQEGAEQASRDQEESSASSSTTPKPGRCPGPLRSRGPSHTTTTAKSGTEVKKKKVNPSTPPQDRGAGLLPRGQAARGRKQGNPIQRRMGTDPSPLAGPSSTMTRVTRSKTRNGPKETGSVSSSSRALPATATGSPRNTLYLPRVPLERMGRNKAKAEREKIMRAMEHAEDSSE